MFCNTSITRHLLRGAVAFGLLLAALSPTELPTLLRSAAAGGAFLLMRGCPMCWLLGLFESIARRAKASH